MRFIKYLNESAIKNQLFNWLLKSSMTGDATAEIVEMLFDDDVSVGDLAYELDKDIPRGGTAMWEKKRENAKKEIIQFTQESLNRRGLPEEFIVYRGGEIPNKELVSTSLVLNVARDFSRFGVGIKEPGKPVYAFKIRKSDVVADIEMLGGRRNFSCERELLVKKGALTHKVPLEDI
jgi:hypothetical protein